jgi:hypothetical protein
MALLSRSNHEVTMSHMPTTEQPAEGVAVANTRAINTTAPIAGGGDLSADRTISLNALGVTDAYLAANSVTTVKITDANVTLAKMANVATTTLIGRVTAGTGVPEALTATQATTILNAFTSGLKGLAPASGGGSVNYLRADGTWAEPPGDAIGWYVVTDDDYGATGDGATDDRAAVQAAIDACEAAGGGTVYFPNGTYRLTEGSGYCLTVTDNVRLLGESREGVILIQAASIGTSVRLMYLTGTNIVIQDLTLDGNKSNNTVNEHRHGFLAETTNGLRVENVTSQNFTGDGFYLYTDADDSYFKNCYVTGCERNGMTFGGAGLDGCIIEGGTFEDNAVQQIDSEPGGSIINVTIDGATLRAGASNDFALAIGGFDTSTRNDRWSFTNCVFEGSVYIVWADNVTFTGCRGSSASTDKNALRIYRGCKNIVSTGCHWKNTANVGVDLAVIYVLGAADNDMPYGVQIIGGSVTNTLSVGLGIYAQSFNDIVIDGVAVIGGADGTDPGYSGIVCRSAVAAWPVRSAKVINCYIKNWGSYGCDFRGVGGTTTILNATCTGNTFDSTVASAMPNAVEFNADSGDAVVQATMHGNFLAGNCTTEVGTYPITGVVCIGGSWEARGIYTTTTSPEGVVTEKVGAVAFARDTGMMYRKETGSDTNTGWIAANVFTGTLSVQGNTTLGNAATDTTTINGVATHGTALTNAGGRADTLKLIDTTLATAGDAQAIHFSMNAADTYNSWIKQQVTASSPSFLNPSLVFGTQDEGTTGTGNVTDRLEIHKTGVTVTGTFTTSGVANSNVVAGVEFQHVFEIADAATADYDIVCTHKIEITDVVVIKTGAVGVAVTAQVKNGATSITNAMDLAVADQTIVRPTTIDDASNVIAAAGTLRVSIVRTTSGAGCKVICRGIRRT